MRVEFIDVGGVNTRVIYEGDKSKKAILLIHGFGIGAESWLLNIDAVSYTHLTLPTNREV